MFSNFMSKIESLFSDKDDKKNTSTAPPQGAETDEEIRAFNENQKNQLKKVISVFLPLSEVEQGLEKAITLFIFTGDNPEILLKLNQFPDEKASDLIGNPGTYEWYWTQIQHSKAQEKLKNQSIKSRNLLNDDLFNTLSNEQIIRLGKVYASITQQKNYKELYAPVPVWFHYIVVDALVTLQQGHGFNEIDSKKQIKQHWTLAKLEQLLAADEPTLAQHLPLFLFERVGCSSYYTDRMDLIFKLSDADSYIEQHLDILKQEIPNLSVDGQTVFLDYLKHKPAILKQLPELIVQLTIGRSKTIRDLAVSLLSQLNAEDSQNYLQSYLVNGSSKERGFAAELLARLGEHNLAVLEQALENEKQKSVQQMLSMAVQRLKAVHDSVDNSNIEIPSFSPLVAKDIPESFTEILHQNRQHLVDKAEKAAEAEIEDNKTSSYKSEWAQKRFKRLKNIKPASIDQLLNQINGKTARQSFESDIDIIQHQKKLHNYPEYSLHHALRIHMSRRHDKDAHWSSIFDDLPPAQYSTFDLRQINQALKETSYAHTERQIAQGMLMSNWNHLNDYITEPEKIWPFFAEHPEFISEALGLSPSLEKSPYYQFEAIKAIKILEYFPSIPQQYIPRLLEYALGENKRLRFDAQQALQTLPDIYLRAVEALDSGKQEIRVTAIEWLARLQRPEAVKPLNTLLKKEKKEIVRAALLTALEKLGQDISPYLSEKVLLAEAQQGLKAKISSSFTWFDAKTLPEMSWQNGKKVQAEIIHWWVVLAEKLKDPKANALLQRYLGLLDEKSQQKLANHLLHSFIQQDTLSPTLEQAMEVATQQAPQSLQSYRDSYKNYGHKYPEYYGHYATITLEEVIEEIKRQQLAIYLGSAIKSKGLLALTFPAQGSFAVKQLQDYMKQHYPRRSQIEAMISALSVSDDPLIIQLLLSLSRRYRTASVQTLATDLVTEIAERNQWTSDELADRTIPTAGLNEQGILNLQYGARLFTAIVDDKDKFVLKNDEGKEVKALPAARQNDDESLIKEAKALFSSSKKEFKQVVDMQTGRLYEAMCSERQWNVTEWQEYLFEHPIMKRLVQRLVWLEVKADGERISFRPADDGTLLNLEDDEVALNADSKIQISHAVLVGAEEAQAWLSHFKDYKVKFLFDQMVHLVPELDNDQVTEINDHKGWLTDTYTLRGVITKLGYQRASIEDGGSFDRYTKAYKQLNIHVQIVFSGSYVPEENIPAVLYELSFSNKASYSWNSNDLALKDVPPILLAESYADYLKVAAATKGFDPEWEKKTPW
ncbi:DUF4132 domain-containing protein [Acinetobacter sp. CFCC 10889]|uniref:DUF4132 domain-containing protein n=1 Tax=Acinetobacter sp. CFCC 10889 TaxID=1775557 RepID=UPI000DD09FDC|nr:DUF4132 domain-containing protein [Acinetobacter sp. CFCC 10889]